ncbi:hypothetical protein L1049_011966 [Liquidambar formosana]|uniref:Uncharacterized protein n=1 Tax=Liquidambar formosana TaxID=63359 RepID=A0AAP0RS98_LIQFO
MSSTAPSVAPPSVEMDQDQMNQTATTQPPLTTTSVPLSTWLSMEIRPTGEGTSSLIMDSSREQMYRSLRLSGPGGSSSSMVGSDGAGPSTVPYGREADYHPVVDMADVMFNSGSSSTNSMDFIFPSMEDKWEPDDKKN